MFGVFLCVCFALNLVTTEAYIPQVQVTNSSTVVVRLDPISQLGVILGYHVRLSNVLTWRVERTVNTSKTFVVLTDLQDWLRYFVEVEVYSANETLHSTRHYFETANIPSPNGINTTTINLTTLEVTLEVTWNPIPKSDILGYKIQLRDYVSLNLLQVNTINNGSRIVLSQVPFRKPMYLFVQGLTSNATSRAEYKIIYLDPLSQVTGLKVVLNGTTAVATWDPIPDKYKFVFGKLLGYHVKLNNKIYNKTDNEIVFKHLKPLSRYLIQVTGYTANDTGRFLAYSYFTTECGGVIKNQLYGNIKLTYRDYDNSYSVTCPWDIHSENSKSMILLNVKTFSVRSPDCRRIYLKISNGQGQPMTTLCQTSRFLTFVSFGSVKIELFLRRLYWGSYEIDLSYFIFTNGLDKVPVKDSWSISANSISSTSIALQWGQYPGQETVKNFIAVCTSQNNNNDIFTAMANASQSTIDVTNLHINTVYKVEVVASLASWNSTSFNSNLWKSQSFIAKTLEDVPSKPPDNLKAKSSGPTSIIVSWNSSVDSNGVIIGYNISYKKTHGQSSTMIRVDANTAKIQIKSLQQATEYKITVSALTKVGEGPSRSVYVTTGFLKILTQSSRTFESPNYPRKYPSSANYRWEIAQGRVFDQLFILFWAFDLEEGLHGFCSDFVKVSDKNGNQVLMACGQKNRFAVIIPTSAVIKLQSDKGIEKSGFSASYFILHNNNRDINVKENIITNTQASFSWNNPMSKRQRLFNILYREYESKGTWNFTVANTTYATIDGLKPSTKYELLVTVHNNVTSYASHPITFNTLMSPTSPPTEEPPTDPVSLMYEYGLKAGDLTVPNDWWYTQSYCKKVSLNEDGFLFMTERHLDIYICRNGILRFDSPYYIHWPVYLGSTTQSCKLKMLAPYWCLAERSQSSVYYHVYQTSDKSSKSNKIMQQATSDVIKLHKGSLSTSFKASWVLVVTWENLLHSTQNTETKDLRNTFQAVLITDGLASFAMYNYPIGGIQWSAPTTRDNWDNFNGARGLPVVGWIAGMCNRFGFHNVERSATPTIGDIDRTNGHSISISET